MKIKMPKYGKAFMSGLAGFGVGAVLVAGCAAGNPTTDDLKNSPDVYPNFSSTILNVDGFPNITILRYQGAGFATTTRDAAGAITLVPEWDQFCSAQKGKQATQNGQP